MLSIFYPELIEAAKVDKSTHMLDNIDEYDFTFEPSEIEDGVDEMIQVLTEPLQCRQLLNLKKDEEPTEVELKKSAREIVEAMYTYATLEQMICQSITSIQTPEIRNKMASKILLTGGLVCATEYVDLVDIIEDRLIHTITQIDKNIEKVDVIQIKDQDPKYFTWVGGSVIPRLETSKDMFVEREQYTCDPKEILENSEEKEIKSMGKKKTEEEKETEEMHADAKVFNEPNKQAIKT